MKNAIQRSDVTCTVLVCFYKTDLCTVMYLPYLKHWDLGIYFSIYNSLFWLVTSKGNSVFHTCILRAVSTQVAREVRRAYGLTDFKWNTIQNNYRNYRSFKVLAVVCSLCPWQFLTYYVPRVRHFWLITWKLAAFNEHSNRNGSCYSAPGASVLSSWVYYAFLCSSVYYVCLNEFTLLDFPARTHVSWPRF